MGTLGHGGRRYAVTGATWLAGLVGAALVGAALVAGCGPAAPPVNPPPSTSGAPSTTATPSESSGSAPSGTQPTTSAEAVPGAPGRTPSPNQAGGRCQTEQLAARIGRTVSLGNDQTEVPLVYTNTSGRGCQLHGVPGLDLRGPNDPNGPVYSLPRQDRGGNVTLAPGTSATAKIVVLSWTPGSSGSSGSMKWVPTQLVTIPPGQTTPLTVPWPNGLSVLRQDAATHPGSWVESFIPGAP